MKRTWRYLVVVSLLMAGVAWAQDWKGKATLSGTVTDSAGKPVSGVVIALTFGDLSAGPEPAKTNNKGQWEVKNLADGKWLVKISKEGFDPQESTIEVGGQAKNPHIQVRLAPTGSAGVNAELTAGDQKAQALIAEKKYADARAVYQDLLTKYPKAVRVHIALARVYDAEGKYSEAADELNKYLATDPQNLDVGLSLASEYAKAGRGEEALKLMRLVPADRMKNSQNIQQCGVSLMLLKKPVDAIKFFELALERYPKEPTNLYYRGLCEWQIGSIIETPGTPKSRAHFERAAADLKKFVSLAPNSPEAAKVPEILGLIK